MTGKLPKTLTGTWIELRDPHCVPERKGPFSTQGDVVSFIREVMDCRPGTLITVVTTDDLGVHFEDGPQYLQISDGRSMKRASRHSDGAHEAHFGPRPPLGQIGKLRSFRAEDRVRALLSRLSLKNEELAQYQAWRAGREACEKGLNDAIAEYKETIRKQQERIEELERALERWIDGHAPGLRTVLQSTDAKPEEEKGK